MSSAECCGGVARRSVLTAAVAGTATLGLAACAAADTPASPSASDTSAPTDASATPAESTAAATVLGATSAIEVGGGAKFPIGDSTVLVTQPQSGEFVAFDARCTHQGCVVSGVTDGEIRCGCHGAKFDIATGEVLDGPADSPLKPVRISVVNDEIILEN